MNIIYLKHNQINKEKWDHGIRYSLNHRIYAWSWYLDIVCPGWEALVSEDYSALFPLTMNRKYGIWYLFQPFFAQQAGLFSTHVITEGMLNEFLEAIPQKFRYVDIHLNSGLETDTLKWKIIRRINYEMSLKKPYQELFRNYHQNTRRNLKKAGSRDFVHDRSPEPLELIKLFRTSFGEKEGKLTQSHYNRLENLMKELISRNMASLEGIFGKDEKLLAGACFVKDNNRWYFLFAASDPVARENGAMFTLINRFISNHAEEDTILDFEGGNDTQLGRFYHGFGAEKVSYPALRLNRFPAPVRQLISYLKKNGHS